MQCFGFFMLFVSPLLSFLRSTFADRIPPFIFFHSSFSPSRDSTTRSYSLPLTSTVSKPSTTSPRSSLNSDPTRPPSCSLPRSTLPPFDPPATVSPPPLESSEPCFPPSFTPTLIPKPSSSSLPGSSSSFPSFSFVRETDHLSLFSFFVQVRARWSPSHRRLHPRYYRSRSSRAGAILAVS